MHSFGFTSTEDPLVVWKSRVTADLSFTQANTEELAELAPAPQHPPRLEGSQLP